MKNKKLLRATAALLVGVVGVAATGCSFSVEQPDWLKQKLCDHVFDEQEILRDPTCIREGKTEKICSDCGTTKIVAIPATGDHTWDDGVTSDGMTTFTCTVCGVVETQEQEAPSCLHNNYDPYGDTVRMNTCLDCGAYIPDLPTSAVSVGDAVVGWYRFALSDDIFAGQFEMEFDFICDTGIISAENALVTIDYMSPYGAALRIGDFSTDEGYQFALQDYCSWVMDCFTIDGYVYIFIPSETEKQLNVDCWIGDYSFFDVKFKAANFNIKTATNVEKVG